MSAEPAWFEIPTDGQWHTATWLIDQDGVCRVVLLDGEAQSDSRGKASTCEAAEFARLCEEWKQDTECLSNLNTIHRHLAYQRIIGMGVAALPLILERLRDEGGHWFYALAVITGQDAATGHQTISGARHAWLDWGTRNGYLSSPVPPCSKEHR